jgi:hypothetical protein
MRVLWRALLTSLLLTVASLIGIFLASATEPTPIAIPENQWVGLAMPPEGQGIYELDKHVSVAFSPLTNRVYFVGGDYLGESYRNEVWSLDIAERWRDRTNPAAGWRLEYPYCGPIGAVQPKGPDFVGWTWDPRRNVFWMVPGEMQPHGNNNYCPGERPDYYGDEDGTKGPRMLFRHIMTFDPATMRWADYDGNADGGGSNTWQSVYDPVTDTLIRASPEDTIGVYEIARKRWTRYPIGSVAIRKAHWATDYEKRRIFMIDPERGRLHRWDMDARVLRDLGKIPLGAIQSDGPGDKAYCVWDPKEKVLIHYRYVPGLGGGVYLYHPDDRPPRWETANLPVVGDAPEGTRVHWNSAAYDPHNGVIIGIGDSRFLYLLRYSKRQSPVGTAPAR